VVKQFRHLKRGHFLQQFDICVRRLGASAPDCLAASHRQAIALKKRLAGIQYAFAAASDRAGQRLLQNRKAASLGGPSMRCAVIEARAAMQRRAHSAIVGRRPFLKASPISRNRIKQLLSRRLNA